jgi:hypothetical protein
MYQLPDAIVAVLLKILNNVTSKTEVLVTRPVYGVKNVDTDGVTPLTVACTFQLLLA